MFQTFASGFLVMLSIIFWLAALVMCFVSDSPSETFAMKFGILIISFFGALFFCCAMVC
jgi:hypothetical protein